MFYVSTTPWLRRQQESEWVNINFERRDLNSPQKSHLSLMILGKFAFVFAFSLGKQNVTGFFSPLQQKTFCCAIKLLLPGTVSFCTSCQRWLIRQWLIINTPCSCLVLSLIFSLTKQPYSKVGNSGIYWYQNAVFTSLKNKKWGYQFRLEKEL